MWQWELSCALQVFINIPGHQLLVPFPTLHPTPPKQPSEMLADIVSVSCRGQAQHHQVNWKLKQAREWLTFQKIIDQLHKNKPNFHRGSGWGRLLKTSFKKTLQMCMHFIYYCFSMYTWVPLFSSWSVLKCWQEKTRSIKSCFVTLPGMDRNWGNQQRPVSPGVWEWGS
jgi:hypothetical protein